MKTPAILLFIWILSQSTFAQKQAATDCCRDLFLHPDPNRMVSCLAVLDPENKMNWLFDATPNLPFQMKALKNLSPFSSKQAPDGIFLTHAHIGHYAGLMYLGRE
eukprot:gene16718-20079_t